jgi:PAS domain S-box-containing protein
MKSPILLVSTYPELAELAKSMADNMDMPLSIYEGGIMKGGHLYAKKVQDNYDVIISQGGTAAAIKTMVQIPVVSIEIGVIDLLEALYKAAKYGGPVALISYRAEELYQLESLKKMFSIDYKVFPYSNNVEFKKQVDSAIAFGKTTLVGMGHCIYEAAEEKNLNSILIKSRKKSIKQALISAKNIIEFGKKERFRAERFKAVIDNSSEGIISIDKNNIITTLNPVAEKILNIKSEKVLGKQVSDLPPKKIYDTLFSKRNKELDKLIKINSINVLATKFPIIVDGEQDGAIISLQDVSNIQKLEQKARVQLYAKGLVAKYNFSDIIGESEPLKDAISNAKKYGKTSATILIQGETGTGKELFAQSIHNISPRKKGPFVAINCAALPESLLESELFGYEEGAFTGAKKGGKPGLFELAHNGTIFLDEIGEMPLSLQSRLLRVLQEKEVIRIGGDYVLNVDTRVIAATNKDIYSLVKEGKFREDLYFRINILNLHVPPLREMTEDIPLLIHHFIDIKNTEHNTNIKSISKKGVELLQSYCWPGNVRELENFVERLVILADSSIINKDLVEKLLVEHLRSKNCSKDDLGQKIAINISSLKDMELEIIKALDKKYEGNKTLLSEKLGISRTTLWKRLNEIEELSLD